MTSRPEVRMEFVCTAPEEEGEGRHRWMGEAVVKSHSMCMAELFICGRGSCMNAVVGRYKNGQYICIPDLDTGCPLGRLTDTFWNRETFQAYAGSGCHNSSECPGSSIGIPGGRLGLAALGSKLFVKGKLYE